MTLVVIVGVLTGPTIVNCFNSPDGMGVCLRGEMTNAGILPRPAPATVATTTPASVPSTATAVQPATTAADPAPAATTPAEPVSNNVVAATFGLLRAEPDGSVVIAGNGTPGSQVEVYADDALIGTADVEPSGDWVLVPEAPLAAGGLEITLGESGKPGRATESFVVAINHDKSSEPLVVATTPGAASAILQGVETPEPTPQLASAESSQTTDALLPVPVAAAPQAAAVAPVEPTVSQVTTPAGVAASVVSAPATGPAPVPSTANAAVAAPVDDASPDPTPEIYVATAEPATSATPLATPALASTPPTIDAIEMEGESTFFAGAGPEGGSVRLYVDDAFVADAEVSDGRWLVEAGPVLKKPTQRVRVDLLQPGSAEVASRAEVNFAVELPAAVANAAVAGIASTSPTLAVPAPSAPASSASSNEAVTAAAPMSPTAPVAETAATAALVATTTEPPTATTDTEDSIPTMVAVAIGGPDAERFASGKAIIRRGDNLWTIAKRVYGEGIKYTTIYEANTGQIRDPNRIYPGQVFGLPQGTAN